MTNARARTNIITMLGLGLTTVPFVVYHGGRQGPVPMLFIFRLHRGERDYLSIRVSFSGSPWAPVSRFDKGQNRHGNYRWVYRCMVEHITYQSNLNTELNTWKH